MESFEEYKNKSIQYTGPSILHCSENWTTKATDARRITAAEMKYVRKTVGYIGTDQRTNTGTANEIT
jgi:hypothetical protein